MLGAYLARRERCILVRQGRDLEELVAEAGSTAVSAVDQGVRARVLQFVEIGRVDRLLKRISFRLIAALESCFTERGEPTLCPCRRQVGNVRAARW